jgi:hypothetical protein
MSEETPLPIPKPLTIDDPVSEATRARLGALQNERANLSVHLGEIMLEEVKIVRTLSDIDNEQQRIFNELLRERGLVPGQDFVQIDAKTGVLSRVNHSLTRSFSYRRAGFNPCPTLASAIGPHSPSSGLGTRRGPRRP